MVVLTEYYPQEHHSAFKANLSDAGWPYSLASKNDGEIANRVLITSRLALEPFPLSLPEFDRRFPSNISAVMIPTAGLRVLGVRIPAYTRKERPCLLRAWDWLEITMTGLDDAPTVVLGDLNANPHSPPACGGAHFRRILANGWRRSIPLGQASYFGPSGRRSEVDHILCNRGRSFADVRYVTEAGEWHLAGRAGALSDHAALLAYISID